MGSNGYDSECLTASPPATSGGDWGPSWEEAVLPDSPTGSTGFEAPPPEEDPTGWEYSSVDDLYYRSPSGDELIDNPWLRSEDLLVIPKASTLTAFTTGTAVIGVSLPLHDREQSRPQQGLVIFRDTVESELQHTAIPFIEKTATARNTVTATFKFYLSQSYDPENIDPAGAIVTAYATSLRASLAIRGVTADRKFTLRGPYGTSQFDLDIPFPIGKKQLYVLTTSYDPAPGALLPGGGGGAPLVRGGADGLAVTLFPEPPRAAVAQCDDGLDNDPDGFADGPTVSSNGCDFECVQHPDFGTDGIMHDVKWEAGKTIGFFGDMTFCTVHKNAYLGMFMEWADDATVMLNWVVPHDPPMGYDPDLRPPPFRLVMRGCVIGTSRPSAEACDQDNVCPSGHSAYPWRGDSGDWDTIRYEVWDLVNYTVGNGIVDDTHPIQLAVGFPMEYDDTQAEPGLANVYNIVTPATNGASLVRWEYQNGQVGPGQTAAHEIGHNFGLAHDFVEVPGTSFDGFMKSAGGAGPVLDWEADSQILNVTQGEVWQTQVPSKFTPRPSGFRHVGCDDPGVGSDDDDFDCSASEHPNLECIDDYCR